VQSHRIWEVIVSELYRSSEVVRCIVTTSGVVVVTE
jgi:hypothetical protein